jgi:hypothetical protein
MKTREHYARQGKQEGLNKYLYEMTETEMPYRIAKNNGKYEVRKKDGGELIGTHDTRKKARGQIIAIEMREHRPWTHLKLWK